MSLKTGIKGWPTSKYVKLWLVIGVEDVVHPEHAIDVVVEIVEAESVEEAVTGGKENCFLLFST